MYDDRKVNPIEILAETHMRTEPVTHVVAMNFSDYKEREDFWRVVGKSLHLFEGFVHKFEVLTIYLAQLDKLGIIGLNLQPSDSLEIYFLLPDEFNVYLDKDIYDLRRCIRAANYTYAQKNSQWVSSPRIGIDYKHSVNAEYTLGPNPDFPSKKKWVVLDFSHFHSEEDFWMILRERLYLRNDFDDTFVSLDVFLHHMDADQAGSTSVARLDDTLMFLFIRPSSPQPNTSLEALIVKFKKSLQNANAYYANAYTTVNPNLPKPRFSVANLVLDKNADLIKEGGVILEDGSTYRKELEEL